MKPFPIPVVPLGPGSQTEELELDYMQMPKGMHTYSAPLLPEPEEVVGLVAGRETLRSIHRELKSALAGCTPQPVDLGCLDTDDLALVNQMLGEGEVSARIEGETETLVQESVFAGIWRCVTRRGVRVLSDTVQIGAIPAILAGAARAGARAAGPLQLPATLPDGVMNAPAIVTELNDHFGRWKPGSEAHVINLTLLPLSLQDISFMDELLGVGNVVILSRGYGNCRIGSTGVPHCWRVVYYNSQDAIILNTIEVVDMPEVACAAREDLEDSDERLDEVLKWVEGE